MKKEVEKVIGDILNDNADSIDVGEFTPVFEVALKDGVATDVLDAFYEADVSPVPTEQLFAALKKHYIDNNSALTSEERSAKAKFIQYLINKYQISIFESMLNN